MTSLQGRHFIDCFANSTMKISVSHFALKVLIRFLFKDITNHEVIKILCPPKDLILSKVNLKGCMYGL